MNHHVNKNYGLTNEVINHDFSLPDNEYAQFSVIGHGLETISFVMFEAARIKDSRLFNAAETVFKKHVDVATEALYGGYFHSLQQVDNYIWSLDKSLWCQQEVLNGSLMEHYHHARQLMLGILSVERIIERGGKVSGLLD